jgi:uncharacterized protein YPO0396
VLAYYSIARAQAKAGNSSASKEAIDLAKQAAADIEDTSLRAGAFWHLAEAEAKAGDLAAFKEAIQLTKEAIEGMDPEMKVMMYVMIGAAQEQAGDLAGANRTAAGLGATSSWWMSALTAEAQAQAGDFPAAMATAAGIEEPDTKAYAYRRIAEAQARAGDFAGAQQTASGIVSSTLPSQKAEAYAQIAEAQAKAGEVEELKAWVGTLRERDEVMRACLGAAKGLLKAEDPDAVARFLD